MIQHLGRQYYYDDETKTFYRLGIIEKKHLLWRSPFCGVPFFNKDLYENYKHIAKTIGAKSDKHKWSCPIALFEEYKQEISDSEPQVSVEPYWWTKSELDGQT